MTGHLSGHTSEEGEFMNDCVIFVRGMQSWLEKFNLHYAVKNKNIAKINNIANKGYRSSLILSNVQPILKFHLLFPKCPLLRVCLNQDPVRTVHCIWSSVSHNLTLTEVHHRRSPGKFVPLSPPSDVNLFSYSLYLQ